METTVDGGVCCVEAVRRSSHRARRGAMASRDSRRTPLARAHTRARAIVTRTKDDRVRWDDGVSRQLVLFVRRSQPVVPSTPQRASGSPRDRTKPNRPRDRTTRPRGRTNRPCDRTHRPRDRTTSISIFDPPRAASGGRSPSSRRGSARRSGSAARRPSSRRSGCCAARASAADAAAGPAAVGASAAH